MLSLPRLLFHSLHLISYFLGGRCHRPPFLFFSILFLATRSESQALNLREPGMFAIHQHPCAKVRCTHRQLLRFRAVSHYALCGISARHHRTIIRRALIPLLVCYHPLLLSHKTQGASSPFQALVEAFHPALRGSGRSRANSPSVGSSSLKASGYVL